MNRKIIVALTFGTVFVLFLSFFAGTPRLVPALAKVTTTDTGAAVGYFSGGNVSIDIRSLHFLGGVATNLVIYASDFAASSIGQHDTLVLFMQLPIVQATPIPFAIITTSSPAGADVSRARWFGTPVYNVKNGLTLDNVRIVSSNELKVDRHGNSLTVDFNPASLITLNFPNSKWPTPTTTFSFVLPAFHLEWNKVGGSFHSDIVSTSLVPFSGYTLEQDLMGFAADATFTSSSWGMNSVVGTDAFVIMHGIQTWTPPET